MMIRRMAFIVIMIALVATVVPARAQDPEAAWRDRVVEANTLLKDDQLPQAEAAARRALTAAQEIFGANHTHVAETAYLLMQALARAGRPADEIEALLRRIQGIERTVVESRSRTFEMTWDYGPPEQEWPDAQHVVLALPNFPGYSEHIFSTDLGGYLEKLPNRRVRVTFQIQYDRSLKQTVSHRIARIGELEHWQSYFSINGSSDPVGKSPWDPEP